MSYYINGPANGIYLKLNDKLIYLFGSINNINIPVCKYPSIDIYKYFDILCENTQQYKYEKIDAFIDLSIIDIDNMKNFYNDDENIHELNNKMSKFVLYYDRNQIIKNYKIDNDVFVSKYNNDIRFHAGNVKNILNIFLKIDNIEDNILVQSNIKNNNYINSFYNNYNNIINNIIKKCNLIIEIFKGAESIILESNSNSVDNDNERLKLVEIFQYIKQIDINISSLMIEKLSNIVDECNTVIKLINVILIDNNRGIGINTLENYNIIGNSLIISKIKRVEKDYNDSIDMINCLYCIGNIIFNRSIKNIFMYFNIKDVITILSMLIMFYDSSVLDVALQSNSTISYQYNNNYDILSLNNDIKILKNTINNNLLKKYNTIYSFCDNTFANYMIVLNSQCIKTKINKF